MSLTPQQWAGSFSAPPALCSASTGWNTALVRSWNGTSARMEKPSLDHHCVVLHLGGAKRISRRAEGVTTTVEAEEGAVTLMPAQMASSWQTEGPIDFAHLYLQPKALDRVIQEEFDRDPHSVSLVDCVGQSNPLLSELLRAMIAQVEAPGFASRLMLDSLLNTFMVQLLCEYSTLAASTSLAPHALPPRRLRRVLEFIEANLRSDIALDDLAEVAGSSRFHFSRAFHNATGFPPYRYLVHRRIDAAKTLLLHNDLSIAQVAVQCGFNSQAQFSAMFKRVFGTTPARFRREH